MSFGDDLKLWTRKKEVTGFKPFRQFLTTLLAICSFNVLGDDMFSSLNFRIRMIIISTFVFVGCLASTIVILRYWGEVEEVITGAMTFIMLIQVSSKMLELVVHRENHREILRIVEEKTANLQDDPINHAIGVRHYLRARRYIALTTSVYLLALASLVIYPFLPVLINGSYKLATNLELPFTRHKELHGWILNNIFASSLTCFTCFVILAYDVLFYVYVFHITGRFEILEHQLKMIGDFQSLYNTEEKQHDLLVDCSKLHIETIEFISRCSKQFSLVYLIISVSDFVVLCVSLFHLRLDILASSGFMFIAALTQSFIFCNCGQIVQSSAESCSRAIYLTTWDKLKRIDQRKIILFMLMESQKRVGFNAGGFNVSLELYKIVSRRRKTSQHDLS